MPKTKTKYVCQNCGAESAKWLGRCTSCGEWNSYVEEVVVKETSRNFNQPSGHSLKPIALNEVIFN
jgi:DNA repair protein RadA/Sms